MSAALWFAALKPPMYTVAVTPILVGTCAAFADTSALSLPTLFTFLLSAIAIIAWLNSTNDVFDFDTGIDKNKRESVVNLCGANRSARNTILFLATAALLAAFAGLYALSTSPFDPTVLALIGVSVALGYAYQGPPFRLGYKGLGEPITFFTWFLSTLAAYHSQVRLSTQTPPTLSATLAFLAARLAAPRHYTILLAALLVAFPTATILFCSHFHQLVDDAAAGKRSPIVRLGTARASRVLQIALATFFAIHVVALFLGALPPTPALLALAAAPHARELVAFVVKNHAQPKKVRVAKYYAVKFHFIHGVALAAGYFVTGLMRSPASQ